MKGSLTPMNMEAKLREVAAAFAGNGLVYPEWFKEEHAKMGQVAWANLLLGAADELEQRSLLSGRLLRRLAGD